MIDLRTLRPIDLDTVLESVARTNRLLAVEEGPRTGGWASGLLGQVAEHGLDDIDDAWLLATASCRFLTARRSRTRSSPASRRSPPPCASARESR